MPGWIQRAKQNRVGSVFIDVFDWYPSHSPKTERRSSRKLDLSILIFACLSFFCKFSDQSNITNAYVSGMKEDIHADGNALNYFNVAYYTAYVVGQIPLMASQTKPQLAPYLLPALEIIWAVLTFAQSRVTKSWHVYLLRALIGFFEAPSFGGTHSILGSWYRKEELFKRAGVWFMGNSLGSMFSGYLQAAAYKNLNGVHGLAGWRWSFVIDGIITSPIAFIGFAVFPGLPNSPKKWFSSEEEYALATERMRNKDGTTGIDRGIDWKSIKYTLSRPMWYICVSAYICMIQAHYWTGYMTLWLKAEKWPVTLINILPTFINLLQASSSWLGTTLAATVSSRGSWTFQAFFMIFAEICLTIWYIPAGSKFFAFYAGGLSGMASPISYSWINTVLRESTAERGLIISSMMTFGYSTYIWIPSFTFPTVESPRFPKGYPASIAFDIGLYSIVMFGFWFMARKARRLQAVEAASTSVGDEPEASSIEDKEISGQSGTDQEPVLARSKSSEFGR